MEPHQSAMVVLWTDSSDDEFYNESLRESVFDDGVEKIKSNVVGIQIVTSNKFACTLTVCGPKEAIANLQEFVKQEGLGKVELEVLEKPALRSGLF